MVVAETTKTSNIVVPIRSLGPGHRERIAVHLKALDADDRYLRFGYSATDEQIERYVASVDFDRDDIFGVYNRKLELIAMAHLAYSADPNMTTCAEFGVSVLKKARGRGFGQRLFDRAAIHARNEGVEMLFVHALSENRAMLHIALKAGAKLERAGSETEAYLRLPPATFDTRMAELLEEQLAQTDYTLKQQAKRFWAFLAGVQQVRSGVRSGRHKSGT
ncbi:MAG TPA: GNAT family N-acetyltransferase [Ramlibacter sp.]|jgi:GNAT superfamily N-acetyltransferase|nr:GNAT family N-acetyltransferase [Ramlibacter sp.]